MNNPIPCFISDSDQARLWDEADAIDEDEETRTPLEIRLSWICDDWRDAITGNTYDQWRDLRMMVYGASQTLVHCNDRHEDHMMLITLGSIAFQNSIDCLCGDMCSNPRKTTTKHEVEA